jgi:hypothetical protein
VKRGVPAASFRAIEIQAVADEGFKQLLPNEARFRVTKWRAYLVRNNQPIAQEEFNGPTANLTSFAAKANKGDRVVMEILDVKRLNHKGQAVDVNVRNDFQVTLN